MDAKELVLETQCAECEGRGVLDGDTCHACDGTHYVPTAAGEAVLELVRRHLRINLSL